MTTANRQDFIARTRRLALAFVQASDTFKALAAELLYTPYALPADQGGLSADDFALNNADLTVEQLLAFYQTMEILLSPLTDDQKRVIYAVKGGGSGIGIA